MIRPARQADCAQLDSFLRNHAETSMFLRSNLAKYGVEDRTSNFASTYWLAFHGAEIRGVFAKSNHGYMMVQAPAASDEFWTGMSEHLTGLEVRGMTGVPEQVDRACKALGLRKSDFSVHRDEPLYCLQLTDMPQWAVQMRCACAADQPVLERWYNGYLSETGGFGDPETRTQESNARARQAVSNPDVMILFNENKPVSMATVNARVPKMVQIGGVYTPPEYRNRGFARRAVMGLLSQQVACEKAILFAATPAACRAYEAIGFRHIGAYRVAMLHEHRKIGVPR